jgi:hypothetical protein
MLPTTTAVQAAMPRLFTVFAADAIYEASKIKDAKLDANTCRSGAARQRCSVTALRRFVFLPAGVDGSA